MKICTFASGSSGNCALIQSENTSILIDAGISMKRIKSSLSECGLRPGDISGILITHCHSDHVSGLEMMSKYFALPIFAPRITAGVLSRQLPESAPYIVPFDPCQEMLVGDLVISSFRTPHDAYDSVGYVITDGKKTVAFVTDLGHVTQEIETCISGANAAVIEANHDINMLKNGPYPYMLKKRIIEDNGHLSNSACAALAVKLFESGTGRIMLAHLSSENNTPTLAYRAVSDALSENGCLVGKDMAVSVAPRSELSDFFEV